jgi:hypothetical protein
MSDATATKSNISMLELVYPPMSNQEADWFKDDPEFEPLLRESDFYVIGGRPEAKFSDFEKDDDEWVLRFTMTVEGGPSDDVRLDIKELSGVSDADPDDLRIELGSVLNRDSIWNRTVIQASQRKGGLNGKAGLLAQRCGMAAG